MSGANAQVELFSAGGKDPASLYESDEFRLYCFKILPCSRRVPHEWSSCPFAHPTEKAKRRNIRTYSYDCEMCAAVVKGEECPLGSSCPHSHNVFESWLHPQKYRTLLCKDKDKCTRAVCFFAHGEDQLRTPAEPSEMPHTGRVDPMSAISLRSTISSGTAQSPHISSTSISLQSGPQGRPSTAVSWPLGGAATAFSNNPSQAVGMQQMLSTLMHQMQTAQQEANQQRAAAQQAEARLQAVTAALARDQAAVSAASAGPAAAGQGLSMAMQGGCSMGATCSVQSSMGSPGASSPLMQLLVQQLPASLEVSLHAVAGHGMEPLPGSYTSLLQLAGQQLSSLESVQSRLLDSAAAAACGVVAGAGNCGQSALAGPTTAQAYLQWQPSASAPLPGSGYGCATAALSSASLQSTTAGVTSPGASMLVPDTGCWGSSQSPLLSETALGALQPLQPLVVLQPNGNSMPLPHNMVRNSQQLLDTVLVALNTSLWS